MRHYFYLKCILRTLYTQYNHKFSLKLLMGSAHPHLKLTCLSHQKYLLLAMNIMQVENVHWNILEIVTLRRWGGRDHSCTIDKLP